MKNLNATPKFKLNKTIVTRFTKPGATREAAFMSTTIVKTSTSIIDDTFI